MLTHVYVDGKQVKLDPKTSVGQGGEAEVFRIGPDRVVKVYKRPEDIPGQGDIAEMNRQGAKERLKIIQHKLPNFPNPVPDGVVGPLALAYDKPNGGHIVGYVMPFIEGARMLSDYADIDFCEQSGITLAQKLKILRSLHKVTENVHRAGMVIGDYNSFNVLVVGDKVLLQALLIDADSMQFGQYLCKTYLLRYVDPKNLKVEKDTDTGKDLILLGAPHSEESDWYSFDVISLETLCCHPYEAGVHRPAKGSGRKKVQANKRALKRLWVGHDEVKYPGVATPLTVLSGDLLGHYEGVFGGSDVRGKPNIALLEREFQICSDCGFEHQRDTCPKCSKTVVVPVTPPTAKIGQITVRKVFETAGVILQAVIQGGKLRYLFHQDGKFQREHGLQSFSGTLNAAASFVIHGDDTLVGTKGKVIRLSATGQSVGRPLQVDRLRGLREQFASDGNSFYYARSGILYRHTQIGPVDIGDTLEGQTILWSGEQFGLTFYQAGTLRRAALFDKDRTNLLPFELPKLQGKLMEVAAYFSDRRCWLFLTREEKGIRYNHCVVVNTRAQVVASGEAQEGDGSWLGQPIRSGKCAAKMGQHECLFAVTDSGLVPVVPQQGRLAEGTPLVGTEDIVEPTDQLRVSKEGLFVVRPKEILLLKTK